MEYSARNTYNDKYAMPKQTDKADSIIARVNQEFPRLDTSAKEVINRIVRLYYLTMEQFSPLMESHRLNLHTFALLATLRMSGPPYCLQPKALLDSVLVTSGGLSNILNRLEKLSYIRRMPDPNDGRGVMVKLTAQGKRAVDKILPQQVDAEHRITKALTPNERKQLARLLKKVLLQAGA